MFFVDLLFALLIGLLLSVLFTLIFDARGPWDIFWVFLLLVVLGSWVGGLWLVPFGPVLFDVAWIPFLLAGLFFALILAAATPPPPFSTRRWRQNRSATAAGNASGPSSIRTGKTGVRSTAASGALADGWSRGAPFAGGRSV